MLNIKKELLVFFCACLTGVNVRAGYEILIFLRKMIIHNNLVKGIEDLFYWIFMSAYCPIYGFGAISVIYFLTDICNYVW